MAHHGPVTPRHHLLVLSIEVDRHSPVHPYRQVAAALIAAIERGEYQPDDRLPGIADIVAAAGVARLTARKALALVAEQGYAELATGLGYYVTRPPNTLSDHALRGPDSPDMTH